MEQTEQCHFCNKKIGEKIILCLNVVNQFTGMEVNEPEFLICWNCWQKKKKEFELIK